jgi:hypothetical protein
MYLICSVAETPIWSEYENGDPGTGSVRSTRALVATSEGNWAAGDRGVGRGKEYNRGAFLAMQSHGQQGVCQWSRNLRVSRR